MPRAQHESSTHGRVHPQRARATAGEGKKSKAQSKKAAAESTKAETQAKKAEARKLAEEEEAALAQKKPAAGKVTPHLHPMLTPLMTYLHQALCQPVHLGTARAAQV